MERLSRRAYLRQTLGWGWRVALIIWAGLGIFDFVQGQAPPNTQIPTIAELLPNWPWWLWLIIGLGIFIGAILEGSFRKYRELRDDVDKMKSHGIRLIFDPNLPSCVMRDASYTHPHSGKVIPEKISYRIGVQTIGQSSVDDVEVLVQDFTPQGAHFLPVPLKPMHAGYNSPSTFTVNPATEITQFVEFVRWPMPNDSGVDEIMIGYHDRADRRHWPNLIPRGRYIFTLLAQGRNAVPDMRRFIVEVDTNDQLQVVLYNGVN